MGEKAKSMRLEDQALASSEMGRVDRILKTIDKYLSRCTEIESLTTKAIEEIANQKTNENPRMMRALAEKKKGTEALRMGKGGDEIQARARRVQELWRAAILKVILEKTRERRQIQLFADFLRQARRKADRIHSALKLYTMHRIYREARVFICTIDSIGKMMRHLSSEVPNADALSSRTIHSVIVDEAGCVLEPSMLLFLTLRPQNILLVGDPRQLRPFSRVEGGALNHDRSLLERAEADKLQLHILKEQ